MKKFQIEIFCSKFGANRLITPNPILKTIILANILITPNSILKTIISLLLLA